MNDPAPQHPSGRSMRLRRPLSAWWSIVALALTVLTCNQNSSVGSRCRPIDSAWAAAVHVTDSVTRKPVDNARVYSMPASGETDSLGWLCLRSLAEAAETFFVSRPGYRSDSVILNGIPGQVVRHELRFVRVPRPCCDLRGQWQITLHMDSAAALGPRPTARTVTGGVNLGPRYQPPQEYDDLDSLVRIVRGLHQVDFKPFFGGPYARDVSTSIFGDGPNLFYEVEAMVTAGDSVRITFIPRMSHGGLSLTGRIRSDTIRGTWIQNAYCCGARGRFTMSRMGPVDTTPPVENLAAPNSQRRPRASQPLSETPPGTAPDSRWRPELAVGPGGRLWLANGGLFVADSFMGKWRRVLGGEQDPVEADELRIGIHLAFVGTKTVLVGLQERYPVERAPVLYRTENAGGAWSAVPLSNVSAIDAIGAVGSSVWVAASQRDVDAEGFFQSSDGGRTWVQKPVPASLRHVTAMYRVSESTAYLATSSNDGEPALWKTSDGGIHWLPILTPSEQGLQRLRSYDSQVEQIAVIGTWLLVREHGRVFVTAESRIDWRPLEGIEAIASEPDGDQVFVLLDSLRPALLEKDLRVAWQSDRRLPVGGYIEEPIFGNGVGYVPEGGGAIHEIRNRTLRVIRPAGEPHAPSHTEILITPPQ